MQWRRKSPLMQSLSDIMKNRKTLSEPELRYFAVQMADIMQYLKGKQIIHRE